MASTFLSRSNHRNVVSRYLLLTIFLVAFALYIPPYATEFVGDDYLHLGYVAEFLSNPLSAWKTLDPFWTDWYYRPTQNLGFLALRLLFGLNAFPYYVAIASSHLLTVALVYALGRRLGLSKWNAVLAAFLFALNAQHQDVASWASSMAIIVVTGLMVAAAIAYHRFLQSEGAVSTLWLVFFLFVVALLTHEQSILLLPVLLAMRWLWARGRRLGRAELLAFAAAGSLLIAYVVSQWLRPNPTLQLRDDVAANFVATLNPWSAGHFAATAIGRWLLLDRSSVGVAIMDWIAISPVAQVLAAVAILLLLATWYHRGNKPARFGLIWMVLHLGLVYLTLWRLRPDLFAGRHLYGAWVGVTLALSGMLALAYRKRPTAAAEYMRALALFLLLGVVVAQVYFTVRTHRQWQEHLAEVAAVRSQLYAIAPAVTEGTSFYAHSFVLQPGFTPFAAAAWFDEPLLSGGSLEALQQYPHLDGSSYIVGYQDERLFDLAPELRRHERSWLLWEPDDAFVSSLQGAAPTYRLNDIAGPPMRERLALLTELPARGTLTLRYEVTVPQATAFWTAFWSPDDVTGQVRMLNRSGEEIVSVSAEPDNTAWSEISLPVSSRIGERVTIMLETQGMGAAAWAIPRFQR